MHAVLPEQRPLNLLMRSDTCLKAGIYFSHYECFGHTSIVIAIGEVFKKRFPQGNLFFIQAGLEQPKAKVDQLGNMYSLPGTFVSRRNFREPVLGGGAAAAERSKICADIITREKPDLFITEFFPLGWEEYRHELIPPLVKASSQDTALWAVSGHPLISGTNYEWRDKIVELYQQIIILSPVREKELIADSFIRKQDKQRYLDFFKRNEQKITFAGYLLPKQEVVIDDEDKNIPKLPVTKGACRVTVVRGGGAYYPKIIAEAILASDLLGKEYYLTVVAGPATTSKEWYFFSTLAGKKKVKNLVLLKSAGNYEELIEKSDVCVSVASYNSAVMILKHRKKAVLIPFEGYEATSFSEQPARAIMLKEMMGAKVLSIGDLTASSLTDMVKKAAGSKEKQSRIPSEWFAGENVLDRKMTELLAPKLKRG